MELFRRHLKEPFIGKIEHDDAGKPFFRYQENCRRCGGAGGGEQWRHTGWTCYECAGAGKGRIQAEKLYTQEQIEKLDAAAAKRAAKKAEKARIAEDERRAPYLAWAEKNAFVLGLIAQYAPNELVCRISADACRAVISPEWLLDVSVAAILRKFVTADIKEASQHVGEIGRRVEIHLSCEKVLDYSDPHGFPARYFYIALMRDEAGNRIVYKGGNRPLAEGEEGRFKVTIKEHSERDGERQTVIQRCKAIEKEAVNA